MARHAQLDAIDRKILALLQRDAETHVSEIAAQVGLSTSPCWRRIQRLKSEGVIVRNVALLNASLVNVGVTVFVSIRTRSHATPWFEQLRALVRDIPEVVEMHRMSGDIDCLLRVVVPDVRSFGQVYRRLTMVHHAMDISSSFALEQAVCTTELPLHHAKPTEHASQEQAFPTPSALSP